MPYIGGVYHQPESFTDRKRRELHSFQVMKTAREIERERLAFLNDPSLLPKNNPALLAPTRVRVLRPFFVAGQRAEIGATVTVDRATAESLAAVGKCEIL